MHPHLVGVPAIYGGATLLSPFIWQEGGHYNMGGEGGQGLGGFCTLNFVSEVIGVRTHVLGRKRPFISPFCLPEIIFSRHLHAKIHNF